MKVELKVPVSERDAPSVAMDLDSSSAMAMISSDRCAAAVHRLDIGAKVVDCIFHVFDEMEQVSHIAMHVADTMLGIVKDVYHQFFQVMEVSIDSCQVSFDMVDAGSIMSQLVNMSSRICQTIGIGREMIVMGRMA